MAKVHVTTTINGEPSEFLCEPNDTMLDALLRKNSKPSEEEVRFWLAGNLCRCTGYDKIVRAVMETAAEMREAAQ